jgi:hypothetical protein
VLASTRAATWTSGAAQPCAKAPGRSRHGTAAHTNERARIPLLANNPQQPTLSDGMSLCGSSCVICPGTTQVARLCVALSAPWSAVGRDVTSSNRNNHTIIFCETNYV